MGGTHQALCILSRQDSKDHKAHHMQVDVPGFRAQHIPPSRIVFEVSLEK